MYIIFVKKQVNENKKWLLQKILHLIVLSRIGKVFAFKWLYKNEEFVRCFKTLTWAGGSLLHFYFISAIE